MIVPAFILLLLLLKKLRLTSYWFFVLFLISIISISPVFGEPIEVEIDWVIEDQPVITKSSSIPEIISEKSSLIEKQIDNFVSPENKLLDEVAVDYITGSRYMLGGQEITIDSEEGQLLNQILIQQKQINKDNFFHMIKYLDRYSDGYIELAEALIDPVKQQNYQQGGVIRDFNINSNLEYFLFERGYDLTNLESIPNNAFSPTKLDSIRVAAAKAANSGQDSVDLRELLPNYIKPDSKATHDEMIRKLSEQTINVYDSISSSELEISVNQNPDLLNSINDNLFDDFQFVNTQFDNTKFESTKHVIDSLDTPQILLNTDEVSEYLLLISISTIVILALIIFGYFLYRKSSSPPLFDLITIPTSINYVENTRNMIESSKVLFENNSPKYAFEKFSQAIRYYYSQKLKIDLDLTTNEIMIELEKSNIDNLDNIRKWLLLCGQVEFVKHKSSYKEFLKALDSFSKYVC